MQLTTDSTFREIGRERVRDREKTQSISQFSNKENVNWSLFETP